jgi:hypothetical protein
MNTTFWGPSGWQLLHTLTFIYPINPSFNDKVKMREFMNSLCFILPCKYCRLSFTKYTKTLLIDNYLDSRELIIEWLYKIHNKVNKKLRIQGFCKHSNPELSSIITHYESIVENITNILNNTTSKTTLINNQEIRIKEVINYICNLGKDFLGSIIFNYQGYFTNCHTGNEKVKIISVYNTFFNSIIPLICSYIAKFCKDGKDCVARYKIPKFNIRNILTQNEPYSKLVKWFYKCDDLCALEDKNGFKLYENYEDYEKYFSKHIVMSCDNPKIKNSKTIKSCRKSIIHKTKTKK